MSAKEQCPDGCIINRVVSYIGDLNAEYESAVFMGLEYQREANVVHKGDISVDYFRRSNAYFSEAEELSAKRNRLIEALRRTRPCSDCPLIK